MKLILALFKYSLLAIGGIAFISWFLDYLNLLDFTLIAYAFRIIGEIDTPLTIIFDYPNVLLLLGFLTFKELLMMFLGFIKSKVVKQ